MKDTHYFQLSRHRFPREAAIQPKTQNVCLNFHALENGLCKLQWDPLLFELLVEQLREERENLLLLPGSLGISTCDLKQIVIVQTIEREGLC